MSGVQKHHGADFVRILRCEQLAMESSHENGGSASASTQESCPGLKQAGQWQQSIAACTLSAEIRGAQGTERSHRLPLPLHCQRFERLSELKMKYLAWATTEFGLHLSTVFSGHVTWACFSLGFEKSAPHRAISTEQYPHRNNQTEGSAHYSPPRAPFFCQQTILPDSLRELERQVARSGELSRAC